VSQILLASRNRKKLAELRRILTPALPAVEVLGLDDVAPYDEVPETGATFADNALLKAREGHAHTGLITVADDSGLTVDALNGMPGVLSARWAGRHGNDTANLELVLAQLADTPDERLGAAFVCAVALVGLGAEQVVHGRMAGHLIREPRGENGFGYDPIFVPDGYELTSSQLSNEEKDAISHRGQALRSLATLLADTALASGVASAEVGSVEPRPSGSASA
jgi:XTP/dITP diphosphohydrolase